MSKKKKVALIGPIQPFGGIATVIDSIINTNIIQENYSLIFINTSYYKDRSSFYNLITFLRAIPIYIKNQLRKKIDIVHIHTSFGRSFWRKASFILLARFFKAKVILHLHSSKFDEFFINSSKVKTRLINFFLKKCDVVILLCKDWRIKIEKKYNLKNAIVINNPVPLDMDSLDFSREESDTDTVKILFLGFLIKSKGVDDLLEIAKKLKEDRLDQKLTICGKGEEENRILQRIHDENIDNIDFLGWVSGTRKTELLRSSDIFLLPSYKEGMPMVILESLAFGLPIVSTNIAGIPDIVTDGLNGYLLIPGDIDGFVNKLRELIMNPELRTKFGEESKCLAESFKRDKISEEWHSLYQNLLEKR